MRTREEVIEKLKKLREQYRYLKEFLTSVYKGSDAKIKVEKELASLSREINALSWILKEDEDLPF